jgi:hypothetical protein
MSQEAGNDSNTFLDKILNAKKHYGNGNPGTGTDIFYGNGNPGTGIVYSFTGTGNGKREPEKLFPQDTTQYSTSNSEHFSQSRILSYSSHLYGNDNME